MEIGDFKLDIISDGTLRLDGGAMFGIVPKVIWEKVAKPDEKNRILIGLNCLLIRTPTDNILVDTGIGEKWSEKELSIYAISHPPTILSSLEKVGLKAEDITIVINTHLHFDHAGGNTRFNSKGEIVPTFPNARYFVQYSEYKHACSPHERDRASYLSENWLILSEEGQLFFTQEREEIIPGITVFRIPGHNLDTQLVKITQGNTTVIFLADIIPTTMHLPIAWVMGYDLYPVELMEQKKLLLSQAISQNWICIFEHDAKIPAGRIINNGKQYQVKEVKF
ncbi:MAG: MBL fold metallo-hydrolase [Acidobacteria bacterium]|nr:MBL fold metallo-hydrolase [Acidobacteriota bacterium]